MCENCANDLKMAEQWTIVAEMARQVIMAEADAGLSIPGAVRPLTDAEILAGVHFGDIYALQLLAAARSEVIINSVQNNLTQAIIRELGSDEQSSAEAAARIMRLMAKPLPKINALIQEAANGLETVFGDVYAGALDIVTSEIQFQNVRPVDFSTLKPPKDVLAVQAQVIATQPWAKLTDKVSKNHLTPSAIVNGNISRAAVRETMEKVPLAGTVDAARQAIHTAHGAGRIDAASKQGATDIWASELLDGKTCEPCAKIDGKDYLSMAAAMQDYPMGGYRDCLGEQRCRGTLVFMYDTPGNSGVDPQGRVTGQIDIGPNRPRTPGTPLPPAQDGPPPARHGVLKEQIRTSIDALNVDEALGGKSFRETLGGFEGLKNRAEERAVLQKLHEGFAQLVPLPDGYTMKVDSVYSDGKAGTVEYNFNNSTGGYAGMARRIYSFESGKLVVEHDLFKLNAASQGHGISSRFLAASEEFYRKLGVEQINIHANIDVGGYAWAKAGFDWRSKSGPGSFADYALSDYRIDRFVDIYPDDIGTLKTLRRKLTKENYEAGTAPTPYDIAMVGYTEGATEWLGKSIMLDSDWLGKKVL
jgi:GNAT superfamily N-acetyltransferase